MATRKLTQIHVPTHRWMTEVHGPAQSGASPAKPMQRVATGRTPVHGSTAGGPSPSALHHVGTHACPSLKQRLHGFMHATRQTLAEVPFAAWLVAGAMSLAFVCAAYAEEAAEDAAPQTTQGVATAGTPEAATTSEKPDVQRSAAGQTSAPAAAALHSDKFGSAAAVRVLAASGTAIPERAAGTVKTQPGRSRLAKTPTLTRSADPSATSEVASAPTSPPLPATTASAMIASISASGAMSAATAGVTAGAAAVSPPAQTVKGVLEAFTDLIQSLARALETHVTEVAITAGVFVTAGVAFRFRKSVQSLARCAVTAISRRAKRKAAALPADAATPSVGPTHDTPTTGTAVDCAYVAPSDFMSALQRRYASTVRALAPSDGALTSIAGMRKDNEDYAIACVIDAGSVEYECVIVADGCGGHFGGRHAAHLAVRHAVEALVSDRGEPPQQMVRNTFTAASAGLASAGRFWGPNDLRTTLIVVVADRTSYHVGWIGDGGCMVHRAAGGWEKLLVPHQSGGVQNLLAASLGPIQVGVPSFDVAGRLPGDHLYIGTDGIFDCVEADLFFDWFESQVAQARDAMPASLEALINAAGSDGRFDDNLTVGVLSTAAALPHAATAEAHVRTSTLPLRLAQLHHSVH